MKKVTISDLSDMTGISRSTISRVLNNNSKVDPKVKKLVEEAVISSGYKKKPAKIQLTTTIKHVSIVSSVPVESVDQFYSNIVEKFQMKFNQMNIESKLILLNEDKRLNRKKLENSEAVILLGPNLVAIAHELADEGIPVVLVNSYDHSMRISSISIDHELGGELAASYLHSQGHKNVAMITAQIHDSIKDRTNAFIKRTQALGVDEMKIIDILECCENLKNEELLQRIKKGVAGSDFGASHILPSILSSGTLDNITGIFCLCDRTAIALIEELTKQNKRVPEDISVVGFDNLSISSMISPALDSIGYEISSIVESTVSRLFHEIEHKNDSCQRVMLGVKMFKRETVKSLD
ncbi:LacI family DNA-binding transcriptional regulator [Vibrio maritimus]